MLKNDLEIGDQIREGKIGKEIKFNDLGNYTGQLIATAVFENVRLYTVVCVKEIGMDKSGERNVSFECENEFEELNYVTVREGLFDPEVQFHRRMFEIINGGC